MRMTTLAVAAAAILVTGAVSIAMPELPHQKAGLWEQTMMRDGKAMPMASSQICLDDATEAKFSLMGQQMSEKMCHLQSRMHNPDGSWSSDATCSIGNGMTNSGHTVVTGDFGSKIILTTLSTMTGAPVAAMNGKHTMVITATRLGPCKPGQRGGDVIMANGMKMNMLDMSNAAAHMGGPSH